MSKKNKLKKKNENLKINEIEISAIDSVVNTSKSEIDPKHHILSSSDNIDTKKDITDDTEIKNSTNINDTVNSVEVIKVETDNSRLAKLSKRKIAITCLSLIAVFLTIIVCALVTYFITSKYKDFALQQTNFQTSLNNFNNKGYDLNTVEKDYTKSSSLTNFLNYLVNFNYFDNLNLKINSQIQAQSNQILNKITELETNLPTVKSIGIIVLDEKLITLENVVKNSISNNELTLAKNNLVDFETQLNLKAENLHKLSLIENEIESKTKPYTDAGIEWNDDTLKIKSKAIVDNVNIENYSNIDNLLSEYKDLINAKLAEIDKNIQNEIDGFIRKYNSLYTICQVYGCRLNDKVEIIAENIFDKYRLTKSKFEENRKVFDDYVISQGSKITDKRILVDVSRQYMYLIENYEIIKSFASSTGDPQHPTKVGEFDVFEKIPNAWGYYHIWMPYWLSIYYAGGSVNGIHGIPSSKKGVKFTNWDAAVGKYAITYGCVMPRDANAKFTYNWAEIGTSVSIVY